MIQEVLRPNGSFRDPKRSSKYLNHIFTFSDFTVADHILKDLGLVDSKVLNKFYF